MTLQLLLDLTFVRSCFYNESRYYEGFVQRWHCIAQLQLYTLWFLIKLVDMDDHISYCFYPRREKLSSGVRKFKILIAKIDIHLAWCNDLLFHNFSNRILFESELFNFLEPFLECLLICCLSDSRRRKKKKNTEWV